MPNLRTLRGGTFSRAIQCEVFFIVPGTDGIDTSQVPIAEPLEVEELHQGISTYY